MELSSQYLTQEELAKKNDIMNYFYSRPTIQWSLECEGKVEVEEDWNSRIEVIQMLEKHKKKDFT